VSFVGVVFYNNIALGIIFISDVLRDVKLRVLKYHKYKTSTL